MDKLIKNKQTVIDFYDLAFNEDKPEEAVEKFTGKEYIQHNPEAENGKDGFIKYFTQLAEKYPGKKVHFKRVIAEDDLVAVHTYQEWPGAEEWTSIDIFRLDENGRIVELWAVIQRIPSLSKNKNGMV